MFRSAALSALAVLAVLAVVWFVYRKFISDDDPEDVETAIAEDMSPTERLGLRNRFSAQSGWMKAFLTFCSLLILVIGISIYQFAQTGTPSEMAYADQLETFVFGLVIFVGSSWFVLKRRTGAGQLIINIEGDKANIPEHHYFDPDAVQPRLNDDGEEETMLVPAYKTKPLFGMFWRPKLVADDEIASRQDKNLPENRVTYEVPMDNSSTWDHANDTVTARASDVTPVSSAKRTATYELVPSHRKSKSEVKDLEMENEQLREERDHEKKRNGILSHRLEDYEEMLENDKYSSITSTEELLTMLRENGLLPDDDDRRQPHRENGQYPDEQPQTND